MSSWVTSTQAWKELQRHTVPFQQGLTQETEQLNLHKVLLSLYNCNLFRDQTTWTISAQNQCF